MLTQLDLFPLPTIPTIDYDSMRRELAEAEVACFGDKDMIEVLIDGNQGYANMSDLEIEGMHYLFFGESLRNK